MKNPSEGLDKFLTYLRECSLEYKIATTAEEETNDATQDILHCVELDEKGDTDLLKIVKVLQCVRNERRKYKDTLARLKPIVDWIESNKKIIDELSRVLGAIRKEEKRTSVHSRMYHQKTEILNRLDEYLVSEKSGEDAFNATIVNTKCLDVDESLVYLSENYYEN